MALWLKDSFQISIRFQRLTAWWQMKLGVILIKTNPPLFLQFPLTRTFALWKKAKLISRITTQYAQSRRETANTETQILPIIVFPKYLTKGPQWHLKTKMPNYLIKTSNDFWIMNFSGSVDVKPIFLEIPDLYIQNKLFKCLEKKLKIIIKWAFLNQQIHYNLLIFIGFCG